MCGEAEAFAKGMCKRCYAREYARKRNKTDVNKDLRSEKTKHIITEYVLENKTQAEIAKEHGVTRQWVYKVIKKAGIKKC